MSQDDEMCEHGDNGSCGHDHSEDRDPCCEPVSMSGRAPSAQCSEACGGHEVHATYNLSFFLLLPFVLIYSLLTGEKGKLL